ncbi:MAG: DUF1080 domain-containing protein [Chloroflexi bacterium]|nr:DUF1080 domain-containing protein [Chloroflexota bacterium]
MPRPRIRALFAALILSALLAAPSRPAVQARGDDVCEPNDTFQNACYLGPEANALGFISAPNDIDAYRIEVLDFLVDAHIELVDRPGPYRVELANWQGDTIASGPEGTIDITVTMPGIYYIFVDSPTGAASDSRPYRLDRRLAYPGSSIPQILYAGAFQSGTDEGQFYSDETADAYATGGKIIIKMKQGGTPSSPTTAQLFGTRTTLTDFTMTVDSRNESGGNAGHQLLFRVTDDDNYYYVTIDTLDSQVALGKKVNGQVTTIVDWRETDAIDLAGNVNRTSVRAAGDDIRVYVNDELILRGSDSTFTTGVFGFATIAWGDPPSVSFDNILITTPTEGG